MAVAIDDRMVDFRPDLFRGHVRTHRLLREIGGSTPRLCGHSARCATTDPRGALHRAQRRPSSPPGPPIDAIRLLKLSGKRRLQYLEDRVANHVWREPLADAHGLQDAIRAGKQPVAAARKHLSAQTRTFKGAADRRVVPPRAARRHTYVL